MKKIFIVIEYLFSFPFLKTSEDLNKIMASHPKMCENLLYCFIVLINILICFKYGVVYLVFFNFSCKLNLFVP